MQVFWLSCSWSCFHSCQCMSNMWAIRIILEAIGTCCGGRITCISAPGPGAGEPTDEADRGRHPGFARHEGLAGGPGSLSLSFGEEREPMPLAMVNFTRETFPALLRSESIRWVQGAVDSL